MPKRTIARAIVGVLAGIGLAVGIALSAGTPMETSPATVADTIWGVAPPQPSPTASAVALNDTIWG